MLGIDAEDILRISAKTGEGVGELLDAVIDRIPPPTGDPDAPLQALIFDSQYDQYRGVVSSIRVMNGRIAPAPSCASCKAGAHHEADEIGVRLPVPTPVRRARPGRGRLPHRRHQGRRRGPLRRDRHRRRARRLGHAAARLPRPQADGVLRPLPGRRRRLREPPRDAGAAEAQRRVDHLRARDVERRSASASAAASSACCTWRSCRSGWSASSTSPSSPPRRRWSTGCSAPTATLERRQPRRPARAAGDRTHRGALPQGPRSSRRPTYTGTVMDLCQSAGARCRSWSTSPERVELIYRIPLAEVVIDFFDQLKSRTPGLRQPRLRARQLPAGQPGEGRHPAQRRHRRRLQHDRPPRQGLRLRPADGREAAGADPAAAVRRAHPGRHRRQGHLPRDGARPSARTSWPSATAATSPASASCSSSRRKARSG